MRYLFLLLLLASPAHAELLVRSAATTSGSGWSWQKPGDVVAAQVLRGTVTSWRLRGDILDTDRVNVCLNDPAVLVGSRTNCSTRLPTNDNWMLKALAFVPNPKPPAASNTPISIRWVAPTENTDGTPLTDLAGYRLYHGMATGVYEAMPFNLGLVSQYDYPPLQDGTHFFALSAVTSAGIESARSNEVSLVRKTLTVELTGLKTSTTTAYALREGNDRLVFLAVGTVPLGIACIGEQRANDFYVVPRIAVTFTGPAQPKTVLAKCQ